MISYKQEQTYDNLVSHYKIIRSNLEILFMDYCISIFARDPDICYAFQGRFMAV